MPSIQLPQGTVHYRTAGPAEATTPAVVFLHPFLMDGSLWSGVADRLAGQGIRSYAPDLPLGSHRSPMHPDSDLSPRGIAQLVVAFLDELDLRDVTLVGADTGGALAQFVLDTDPSRVGSVVLTNCDAFDTFPPFPFNVVFWMLKGRMRMKLNLQPMRLRAFRHSPLGLGLLSTKLDPAQTRSWMEPCLSDSDIRNDAVRFLKAADGKDLLDVSTRLHRYAGPVTIVWGTADRAFKLDLGRRLQQAFGHAQLIEVPDARTLLAIDAPEQLVDAIVAAAVPKSTTVSSAQNRPTLR